jgi:TorA maturation chaperone TorD
MDQLEPGKSILKTALLPLAQEDQARADMYALIARLYFAPPDAGLLADLASAGALAPQAGNPLDIAWSNLVRAARVANADAIRNEFDMLFIGTGTPQVNPYASLYLAGFMMEKPLAALRSDLALLGLQRVPGVNELEDHLAALCETMRVLITGGHGRAPQSIRSQKAFFEKHITPWYSACMDDVLSANGANFYQQVAIFTDAFFSIESQAFEIEETCHDE